MAMTQPAMSGALGRLRAHFDDELLVRKGRDFHLTELAEQLLPVVAEAVGSLEALLGEVREFDPAHSTKQFTVSLSEYAMAVLAEPLTRALGEHAPGCTIAFDALPSDRLDFDARLTRRDLIVGPLGFDLPGCRQPIFTDHLVCLVARDNPRSADGRLTLEDLRRLPHAVAEFAGAGEIKRPIEVVAEKYGLADRTIQVTVTSLLTLPYAIAGTELCAFVPARLARRCLDILDLVVVETPLESVEITEAAHWHPRRSSEPAGRWVRELLYDVAIELETDSRDHVAPPRCLPK
ncbi:LysR family transcriptional regulator [Nonomuraea sp. NPDC026600]|uniref:LysR family transcriptional regulator n=1 Tax=Nonomuraea sp. NPDC026600 TaxID=3155363 RepID=UPI00340A5904